jgi:hypothetical protein
VKVTNITIPLNTDLNYAISNTSGWSGFRGLGLEEGMTGNGLSVEVGVATTSGSTSCFLQNIQAFIRSWKTRQRDINVWKDGSQITGTHSLWTEYQHGDRGYYLKVYLWNEDSESAQHIQIAVMRFMPLEERVVWPVFVRTFKNPILLWCLESHSLDKQSLTWERSEGPCCISQCAASLRLKLSGPI